MALSAEVGRALTFQKYEPSPAIEGVHISRLSKHRSENGWFLELMRVTDGRVSSAETGREPFLVRQVSAAQAFPGRINAFHIHPRRHQSELWIVIQGEMMVWLVDCRAGSRTEGVKQRVLMSGEDPIRLSIPAGVAHGYRASQTGALLVYVADQQFDSDEPDEGRLPWDHFGPELWDEDRG